MVYTSGVLIYKIEQVVKNKAETVSSIVLNSSLATSGHSSIYFQSCSTDIDKERSLSIKKCTELSFISR